MGGEAGKGPDPRPVDKKKWDACPLWDTLERNKQQEAKNGRADNSGKATQGTK